MPQLLRYLINCSIVFCVSVVSFYYSANAQDSTNESDFIYSPKEFTGVSIQGLNKITTELEQLKVTHGVTSRFGNLEIIAHACWESPPGERPESAALLEVWELRAGEQPAKVFSGWMFASNPALSSLAHPVYDLTVIDCIETAEQTPEQ